MLDNQILNSKQFIKMHGAGNSFIIIQHKNESPEQLIRLAMKLCNPNLSIGANTLLILSKNSQYNENQQESAKYYMIVYNQDGSFAEMCGNGLRCFAACLKELGLEKNEEFYIKTDAGIKKNKVYKEQDQYRVKIQMGLYSPEQGLEDLRQNIENKLQNFTFSFANLINFNVPHLVIYLLKMPSVKEIIQYGKIFQKQIIANINFAVVTKTSQNYTQIELQTFQRGCGLTLACGTGACATYVVGLKNNLFKGPATIKVAGGILKLLVENGKVIKDGPAEFICRGVYY